MLPSRSCAYQSSVTSTRSPLLSVTVSRTTTASIPPVTVFLRSVTSTTMRSSDERDTHRLPGVMGQ